MLREITYREFIEWMAFEDLEIMPDERAAQYDMALRSLLININRDPRKKPKPFTPQEMRLYFGDDKPEAKPKQDWKSMQAMGKMMAAQFNAAEQSKARRKASPRRRR